MRQLPLWALACILGSILLVQQAPTAYMALPRLGVLWYYDVDLRELLSLSVELAVVDPDAGPGGSWLKHEVQAVAERGIEVYAYLNAGYAEDWRWYWREEWYADPPWWIGPPVEEWPGEYRVKYWSSEWKSILLSYIDSIASQGFQGVLLDNIDAYEYWLSQGYSSAASEMRQLVAALSAEARSLGLKVMVNIGGGLGLLPQLTGYIDVAMREDVWYCLDEPCESPQPVLEKLAEAREAGVDVMVVDYVWSWSKVMDFLEKCRSMGFIAYAAPSLELNTVPRYIPSHYTVSMAGELLAWSYRGLSEAELQEDYDIYIKLEGATIHIEEPGDQRLVAACYSQPRGRYMVAWCSGSELKAAELAGSELTQIASLHVADVASLSAAPLGSGYAIAYVDSGVAYLAAIPQGVVLELGEASSIKLTQAPGGVLAAWWSHGAVKAAMVAEGSILWVKDATQSDPERYAPVYAGKPLVIASANSSLLLADLELGQVAQVQAPTLSYQATAVELYEHIAYTASIGVALIDLSSLEPYTEALDTTPLALSSHRGRLLAAMPAEGPELQPTSIADSPLISATAELLNQSMQPTQQVKEGEEAYMKLKLKAGTPGASIAVYVSALSNLNPTLCYIAEASLQPLAESTLLVKLKLPAGTHIIQAIAASRSPPQVIAAQVQLEVTPQGS